MIEYVDHCNDAVLVDLQVCYDFQGSSLNCSRIIPTWETLFVVPASFETEHV